MKKISSATQGKTNDIIYMILNSMIIFCAKKSEIDTHYIQHHHTNANNYLKNKEIGLKYKEYASIKFFVNYYMSSYIEEIKK